MNGCTEAQKSLYRYLSEGNEDAYYDTAAQILSLSYIVVIENGSSAETADLYTELLKCYNHLIYHKDISQARLDDLNEALLRYTDQKSMVGHTEKLHNFNNYVETALGS